MDDLLLQFKQYLIESGVAYNTRKNYTSDLSTFVDYLNKNNQYFSLLTLSFVLSNSNLENYKIWLLKNSPLNTVNRRLSSIRKFGNFAIEKKLIDPSEMGTTSNVAHPVGDQKQMLLDKFKIYLETQGNTPNTIRGYLSDVRYYMGIRDSGSQSLSSVARRQNSVNKFEHWRKERQVSNLMAPAPNLELDNTVPEHQAVESINSGSNKLFIAKVYNYLVDNAWVTVTIIGLLILVIALIFLVSSNPSQQIISRSGAVQPPVFSSPPNENSSLSFNQDQFDDLIDPTQTGMAPPHKPTIIYILKSSLDRILN